MTSTQLCDQTGATYRQVDFWARSGLIPGAEARPMFVGSGVPREWTTTQAQFVAAMVRLVKAGVQPRIASAALQKVGNLSDVETVPLPGGLQITLRPRLAPVPDVAEATS